MYEYEDISTVCIYIYTYKVIYFIYRAKWLILKRILTLPDPLPSVYQVAQSVTRLQWPPAAKITAVLDVALWGAWHHRRSRENTCSNTGAID
jgi:hypothetical protein